MIGKYTISPPFNHEAGDEYRKSGTDWQQWRGGALIDTRATPAFALLDGQETVGGNQIQVIYEEQKMPGVMATLTSVTIDEGSGIYRYRFSDGGELEYTNRATAIAAVEEIDTNNLTAKKFLVLASLRQDENGANAGVMEGRSCTIDGAAQSPLSLSINVEAS